MKTVAFWIDSLSWAEWKSFRQDLNQKFSQRLRRKIRTRPGPVHLWEIFKGSAPKEGPFLFDIVQGEGNYQWMRKVWADRLPNNKLTRQLVWRISRFLGKTFKPMKIPFYSLPDFKISEASLRLKDLMEGKGNEPSLTNIKGFSSKYTKWTGTSLEAVSAEIKANDLTVIHFEHLDGLRHIHGPRSERSRDALRKTAQEINLILDRAEIDAVVFFSDHSMSKVTRTIDVSKLVETCRKDGSICFVNSPVIRVWKSSKKTLEILERMEKMGFGRSVTKKDLNKFGLPDNISQGETIFWAKEGVHVVPDFYMGRAHVLGMHGYFKWDYIPFECWSNKKVDTKKISGLDDILGFIKSLLAQ